MNYTIGIKTKKGKKRKNLREPPLGFEPTTVQSVLQTFYHRPISTSDALSPSNQKFRRSITVQSVIQTIFQISISTSDALSLSNQHFRRSIIVQPVPQTLYHRSISTLDDLSPFNQYFRPFITVVLICNDDANEIGKISLVI